MKRYQLLPSRAHNTVDQLLLSDNGRIWSEEVIKLLAEADAEDIVFFKVDRHGRETEYTAAEIRAAVHHGMDLRPKKDE